MNDFPESLGAGAPMVRFAGVSKRYGDLTVLDRLELDVAANEMVSIIGPSGSGKTTVLRLLMTLEEVSDGVIYVEGEPLTHMARNGALVRADQRHPRRLRNKFGMVFQHFNLFPHMTALGNRMEGPVQVLGLAPGSELELEVGMTFHAHSWFTNTDVVDYFISNTVLLGENSAEVLTCETPQTLIVR